MSPLKSTLKVKSRNPKTFEDVFPKLDDGKVDWATVKRRVQDNIDLSAFVFGKMQPNAQDLEEVVVGACLIDKLAFDIARDSLMFEKAPFYNEGLNHIWAAMWRLKDNNEPIDLHTTTFELKKSAHLESVGGAYFLVELTNRIASSANLEYHARIVYQTYLKRQIIRFCADTIKEVYEDRTDVFNTLQDLSAQINDYENPKAPLKALSMTETMDKAANALPKAHLMGGLVKWNDVAFIFSGPGNGKSIFSIQAADAISKGKGLFSNLLRNECGEHRVLYFDFELQYSDYKSRYIDGAGNRYPFNGDNFIRVGNDEDNPSTFSEFAKNAEYLIVRNIEKHKPSIVFVDNITALANGATQDYEVAAKIMDTLMLMKKKYKLTIIVLAHTPKRYNTTVPLSINDLAGSAMLANYADSIIAIGASKMGSNIKYIKQVKVRSGEIQFEEENVIQVCIEKEGAFLQYKTLEEPTGRERDHLTDFNQEDGESMLQDASEYQKQGMGLRKIIDTMGLKMSHTQLGIMLKKYNAGVIENELIENNENIVLIDHNKSKGDLPF